MIETFARDIALQMGIQLSRVSIVEGRVVGCLDVHLLNLAAKGQMVSALVYQAELDDLQNGLSSDRLELKIRATLSRLNMMMEP